MNTRIIIDFTEKLSTLFTVLLLALFVGIGSAFAQNFEQNNVYKVVENSEEHTIFTELIQEVKLDDLLQSEGPYTVLAPTDKAFERLKEQLEELRKNPQQLQDFVIGHLYQGNIASGDVEQAKPVNITRGDIETDNGTVHVIDEVLVE